MNSLINFDSPVTTTASPLIRGPNLPLTNETPNNPFDDAVLTVELNQRPCDPFDIVLNQALKHDEDKLNKSKEVSSTETDKKDNTKESVSDEVNDDDDLRAEIKKFVSERIFKCIKKTLNSSASQTNLTPSKKSSKNSFQRSHSANMLRFGIMNCLVDSECSDSDKLNVSLPMENSTESTLPHEAFNTSTSHLFDKVDRNKSVLDDFELTKEKLRKDAEKMRSLLSLELMSNSPGSQSNQSSDDLWDVIPPWDSCDANLSDEDDSMGLPKLKKYRNSLDASSATGKPTAIEESVIHKYLKKRHSIDLGQPDDQPKTDDSIISVDGFAPEQITASSSILEDVNVEKVDKIEGEAPKLKDVVENKKIEIQLIKEENNPETLRPKKKDVNKVLKKGPMKAVLPLQKMTKNLSAKVSSPFKVKTSRSSKIGKKDEKKEDNIQPVAASTPTKSTDSDEPLSSVRGRENNRSSPTGRKAVTRSQSTSKMEISKTTSEQSTSVIAVAAGSEGGDTKVITASESNSVKRPQSAPEARGKTINQSSPRSALKALIPSPKQKLMRSSNLKNVLRPRQSTKTTAKDKENKSDLKKK